MANCLYQLVSRMAGKPSAPDADDGRNYFIASIISSGDTVISEIKLMSSRVSIAGGMFIDGVLNTESY